MEFSRFPTKANVEMALERFDLRHGQFYGVFKYKNLWWELDGETIGYGDLTEEQIAHIQTQLRTNETFRGWNEHHGTQFQQTERPMVYITNQRISYPHHDMQLARRAARESGDSN